MHSRFAPPALLLLLAACTTKTIVHKDAPGPTSPPDEPASEPAAETCAPEAAAVSSEANVYGSGAVAFASSGGLGIAYVDTSGIPTLQLQGATTKKLTWPGARVEFDHYGPSYVTTSLAANGTRFGFGWYTERTSATSKASGTWSTMFATASPSGETSDAVMGNEDWGRSGTDDTVVADQPGVLPRGDGFLLVWNDMRTKEPRVMNVNLAGWHGLYARAFDANGEPTMTDEQVAQPTRTSARTGVADGEGAKVIWSVRESDFDTTIHVRSGTRFTPAEAPPPVATFKSYGTTDSLASARTANGEVLVVATRTDNASQKHVGSLFLGRSGDVKTAWADWPDVGLEDVAVTASGTGFVVAAVARATSELRVFVLDGSGARVRDEHIALPAPLTDKTLLHAPAVRAAADTIDVALATATDGAKPGERKLTVVRARLCTR